MMNKDQQIAKAKEIAPLYEIDRLSWVKIGKAVGVSDSYARVLYFKYCKKGGSEAADLLSTMTDEINAQVEGDQEAVHKVEVLLGEKTRKIKILVYPGNPETKIGDESKGFEVVVYEPETDDSTEYKKELSRRIQNKMIWKPVFDANSFDDGEQ